LSVKRWLFADAKPRRVVVRTYGRGSLLGLLGPLIAFAMAQRGMDGWQSYAAREMEKDAVRLAGQGYRVVATEELGIPLLGITYPRRPMSWSTHLTGRRAQPDLDD
jgi:hypothetical protein